MLRQLFLFYTAKQQPCLVLMRRSLSTFQLSPEISSLRRITKPFLLKCHPDVTHSDTAKKINLNAIQNLNSYLDSLEALPVKVPSVMKVEIDFILQMDTDLGKRKKSQRTTSSRRRVELSMPPSNVAIDRLQLYKFSRGELVRLIRVAGLSIPADFLDQEREYNLELEQAAQQHEEEGFNFEQTAAQPKSRYELSREKFMANIQWQNYDRLYAEALREMEADAVTTDLLQKYPGRRRTLISAILSRTRLMSQIGFAQQLVAFRRLSLLLEANFDKLHLEEYGKLWESSCRLVLAPAREFSTSSSSLYKRRRLGLETGFSFILHPNQTMSIQVPIDFGDDELIRELENNIWDFYNLITADDDLEELFPDPMAY